MNVQKIDYFLRSAMKRLLGRGRSCPSCGYHESSLVASKYLITELRRCNQCLLMFRIPTTSASENFTFYQRRYSQGFTTDMPVTEELVRLIKSGFKGTEKDYSQITSLLEILGVSKGSRLFDYGCSWGYGSWQFRTAGYVVESFEISQSRRDYARQKLGCVVHSKISDVRSQDFDVFFSSHVLEHVPSPQAVIDFAELIMKPGGLFLAFTPNGSPEYRSAQPERWQKAWGNVHPNFLDKQYYRGRFEGKPYLLMSDPYNLDKVKEWRANPRQCVGDLSGPELMCAVLL